jgi:hypothetical protein
MSWFSRITQIPIPEKSEVSISHLSTASLLTKKIPNQLERDCYIVYRAIRLVIRGSVDQRQQAVLFELVLPD